MSTVRPSQPALWKERPRVLALTANWSHPGGWRVRFSVLEPGSEGAWLVEDYDNLVDEELEDVVAASLAEALGDRGTMA